MKATKNEKFFPLPFNKHDERSVFYVSGMSGSGKTRWTMKMVHYYYSLLGVKNIYIITSKEDENDKKKYEELGVKGYLDIRDLVNNVANTDYFSKLQTYKEKKIKLKHVKPMLEPEEIVELEIELEKIKPTQQDKSSNKESFEVSDFYRKLASKESVFIFDDYEMLPKTELNMCRYFIDYLLINERSKNIHVIIINHKSSSAHLTRNQLNEAQKFVFFRKNLHRQLYYIIHNYIGLDGSEYQRIKNLFKNSNYVCIDRLNKIVTSEKLIYLY